MAIDEDQVAVSQLGLLPGPLDTDPGAPRILSWRCVPCAVGSHHRCEHRVGRLAADLHTRVPSICPCYCDEPGCPDVNLHPTVKDPGGYL